MLSNLYKNNSKVFELAGDFRAKDTNCYNGYFPINGLMKHNPAAEDAPDVYTYDNQKLYYLNRLIKDCKGKSKLVFCESPRYLAADSTVFKPIINLCAKNNILFLNHYNDKEFTGDRKLFYDSGHLNKKGSILYTKKIIKEIRNYYKF
jgi:hypothetical protein